MSRLSQAAPARKEALPAKVALAGPAGSGKTYSALLAAEVFAGSSGRILVIDTEHRRASLYADLAQFDSLEWYSPFDPRELAATIREAADTYAVVIVDSLSHFWMGEGGTLDIVDDAGKRARGNSYAGWKEGTPAQNALYEAILAAPVHVIGCIRSKTEYVLEMDSRGKQVPRKVGMAPVQREGVEYEFDAQLDLDFEHNAIVGKTRCPLLAGNVYGKGKTKEWARTLLDWLNDGTAAPSIPCPEEGCPRTARTKADHVPHLTADHGWTVDDHGKVHRPQLPQQGRSDDDATAEGDAARPGASAAMVPPAMTGGREASEPSPTTARAEAGEGPAAGAAPRSARPTTPAPSPQRAVPPADQGAPPPLGAGSSPAAPPTAGDTGGGAAADSGAPPSAAPAMTTPQRGKLLATLGERGLGAKQARLDWAADTLGRHLDSFSSLTKAEAGTLIEAAEKLPPVGTLEGVS